MVTTYRAAAKFIEKTHDLIPTMICTNVSFVGSTTLAEGIDAAWSKTYGWRHCDQVGAGSVAGRLAGSRKLGLI
jgi:hypothetical protein